MNQQTLVCVMCQKPFVPKSPWGTAQKTCGSKECHKRYKSYYRKLQKVRPPRSIPPEIQQKILDAVRNSPMWYAIYTIAMTCGFRVSEIAGLPKSGIPPLRIGDVFDSDGQIKNVVTLVKTKTGPKTKALSIDAQRAIINYVNTMTQRDNTTVLFPVNRNAVERHFKQLQNKLGIVPRYRLHDLRHTAAINARRKGFDIEEVKDLLGHEDIATTLIYSKESMEDKVKRWRSKGF